MSELIDTIIHGDCLDAMQGLPDDSVDLLLTDPPYGIGFMGKEWDRALPAVDIWREGLRILKPGAFAFVMSAPRQDVLSRMTLQLEDAGFVVNFTSIYWTYAMGLPKAANLSKVADKRQGVARPVVDVVHKKPPGTNVYGDYGNNYDYGITASVTPEAHTVAGAYAGYQPKPAVEVVLVVMKPLSEKTYLDQALANGKGCTWLDDGRIPLAPYGEDVRLGGRGSWTFTRVPDGHTVSFKPATLQSSSAGRFAPNLLVMDDVLNDGRVTKSGVTVQTVFESTHASGFQPNPVAIPGYNQHSDAGSYSRYFSLDAWVGEHLPDSVNRTFPFISVSKPSSSEKNAGLDTLPAKQMYKCDGSGRSLEIFGTTDGGRQPRQNYHATVKPIKLGCYLVTIGSRPGDVVLDPFCGSGSFCVAAAISDRRYIGCELDADMCDISRRRIAWHVREAQLARRQLSLF